MQTRRVFLKSGGFLAFLVGGILTGVLGLLSVAPVRREIRKEDVHGEIPLPPPKTVGVMSLEEAIAKRRSRREYRGGRLTLNHVSQLLWAAQGVTAPEEWLGLRAAPSAGGLYPLEVYIVVKDGGVEELEAGVYHYIPPSHSLKQTVAGDFTRELMAAAVDQEWVGNSLASLVTTAVFDRTTVKYGERGVQYVWQESGHVAQNIYLQATSLGLATTVIGAFIDAEVQRILGVSSEEKPLYLSTLSFPKATNV